MGRWGTWPGARVRPRPLRQFGLRAAPRLLAVRHRPQARGDRGILRPGRRPVPPKRLRHRWQVQPASRGGGCRTTPVGRKLAACRESQVSSSI